MLSTVRSFDLVLLEEGEEYVTDAACNSFTFFPSQTNLSNWSKFIETATEPQSIANPQTSGKGRIRVGTKSLIFEPDALDMPLLKLQFQHITTISEFAKNPCGVFVSCKQVTSIPTSIYNGKSRFISPYTTYTCNTPNGTNAISAGPAGPTSGAPSRDPRDLASRDCRDMDINDFPCYCFLFIYSTPEIQRQQLDEFKKLFYFNNLYNLNYNSAVKDREMLGTNYYRDRGFSINLIPNREKLLLGGGKDAMYCWRLKRMVRHGGFCALTDRALYFQPCPNFSRKLYKRINLDKVLHVFKRDSGLTPTGECATALEVVSLPEELDGKIARKHYRCIYLEFKVGADRERLVNTLKTLIPKSFYAIESRQFRNEMTELWRMGLLPNFQYLDFINCIAGRSRYDISHYPVFPWVISDYASPSIDLGDPKVFRDLSKPIGALNEERLHMIKTRMYNLYQLSNANAANAKPANARARLEPQENAEKEAATDRNKETDDMERLWNMGFYLYGSHYSTPALIVFFLIRLLPECQLRLYGGRFDSAARTFKNIQETFQNTYSGHSSFFELIPEFYENNELFLKNSLNITTQDGRLGDVELPKWAHNNPCQFLRTMRMALESEHVSRNLTNWIDLVFGCKQTGQVGAGDAQNSILHDNTFHPLTYLGSVHAGKLKPSTAIANFLKTMDAQAISVQVREFGQSPIILFDTPHPRKIVFNEFNFDDTYVSSPWFIYVEKHAELFTKGGIEISDSFRLNRTIVPTYGRGHLKEISELASSGGLGVATLPRVDKVTGVGFLPGNLLYHLTSQGLIRLTRFQPPDQAGDDQCPHKVLNVSKHALTCAVGVNNSLFTADTCGFLHVINYTLLSHGRANGAGHAAPSDPGQFTPLHDEFCYMPRGSTNLDRGRHFTSYVGDANAQRIHDDGVTCIDCDDGFLVTGGLDETVRRFQLTNTGPVEVMIFDESAGLTCLCAKNDLLLSCVVGGRLNLWDTRTPNTPIWAYEPANERVVLACGISNHFIQVVSRAKSPVLFWDVRMLNSLGSCGSFMKQVSVDYAPLSAYCDPGDHVALAEGPSDSEGVLHIYDLNLRNSLAALGLGLKTPTITAVNPYSKGHAVRAVLANNRGESVAVYER